MRCNFFLLFSLPACFAFAKAMAVNKHGHDSVEGLPVPIMLPRDHHNERWPWHNGDSSQEKPGGWTERTEDAVLKKKKERCVLKTQHKYYFDFMRKQLHVGGATRPECHCRHLFIKSETCDRLPPCWYFYFADGTCEILKDAGWEALSWCGLYMLWMR